MNKYLKNLNKIEFVVTNACTGKCKHCSQGEHNQCGEKIDPALAAEAVRKIAKQYDITTVMTFGGEPLLHTDAVFSVMKVAKELNIEKRQVITNGYFSKNPKRIKEVARRLFECGVNDLLLSVDVFHQEYIPIEAVRSFAAEVLKLGVPIRLQPAWLVSPDDGNEYNCRTREILKSLSDLNIPVGSGNVIFPEGNALEHLADYFVDGLPENPYTEDPCDVKCVSFSANGDLFDGNIYRDDVMDIIENYTP